MGELERRIEILERRQRCGLAFIVLIIVAFGALAAAKKEPDVLRVRHISVVDANGIERVHIGAPVPEPLILGKRLARGGTVSGVILYDAEGNERSGYVTADDYPNVFFTLDSLVGQHVLFISEPQGETTLRLWNRHGLAQLASTNDGGSIVLKKEGKTIFQQPEATK